MASDETQAVHIACVQDGCRQVAPILCGGGHDGSGGCGALIGDVREVYRCADCTTPFHRECIRHHFGSGCHPGVWTGDYVLAYAGCPSEWKVKPEDLTSQPTPYVWVVIERQDLGETILGTYFTGEAALAAHQPIPGTEWRHLPAHGDQPEQWLSHRSAWWETAIERHEVKKGGA